MLVTGILRKICKISSMIILGATGQFPLIYCPISKYLVRARMDIGLQKSMCINIQYGLYVEKSKD